MDNIIVQPTETAMWHSLIADAQAACDCILAEELESYLVFLLMRYQQRSGLMDSVVAMDFLHSTHSQGKRRLDLLQELGDKSLLFSGLFPGLASKRHVSIDYFIGMGSSAYLSIAEMDESKMSAMFYSLAESFLEMKQVLSACALAAPCE